MILKKSFFIFSVITLLGIVVLLTPAVSKAQSSADTGDNGGIAKIIPAPLTELLEHFRNLKSEKILDYLWKFVQWLIQGLENTNEWLKVNIGFNVFFVIKKIGELFIWIMEAIIHLIRLGLSLIK